MVDSNMQQSLRTKEREVVWHKKHNHPNTECVTCYRVKWITFLKENDLSILREEPELCGEVSNSRTGAEKSCGAKK